jgi:uncharacterized protein YbaR (Trm112 family)
MQSYLVEILACPVCHGELKWEVSERRGEQVETAEARCAQLIGPRMGGCLPDVHAVLAYFVQQERKGE